MNAELVLTAIPLVMFGGGCAMLVASHIVRVRFRRIRRDEVAANNLLRATWADNWVNKGSWGLGTWGLAIGILGILFLMSMSRTVGLLALELGGGSTFVVMAGLRIWDVLHPTEARKERFDALIAARMGAKRLSRKPAAAGKTS